MDEPKPPRGVAARARALARWAVRRFPGYFRPEAPEAARGTPRDAPQVLNLVHAGGVSGVTEARDRFGRTRAELSTRPLPASDRETIRARPRRVAGSADTAGETCEAAVLYGARASLDEQAKPIIHHELTHCGFADHLPRSEHLALLRNIAAVVPAKTLERDWWGESYVLRAKQAPEPLSESDERFMKSIAGRTQSEGYWRMLAGNAPFSDVTRSDPATGHEHVDPEKVSSDDTTARSDGAPAQAAAIWIEEAAVFMATSQGVPDAPAPTPEPLGAGPMSPEEMRERVRGLVQDMGQVYALKMTERELGEKHAAVLQPLSNRHALLHAPLSGPPWPAPPEAGKADGHIAGLAAPTGATADPLPDVAQLRQWAQNDGSGLRTADDFSRRIEELKELTLLGPGLPRGDGAHSAIAPSPEGARDVRASSSLAAVRARRAAIAGERQALGTLLKGSPDAADAHAKGAAPAPAPIRRGTRPLADQAREAPARAAPSREHNAPAAGVVRER